SALSHQRGGSDMRRSYGDPSPSVLEMHEHSAGVLGILLDPVVAGLDVLAVQEPQHPLLELTAALAGDDLDGPGAGALGLVDDLLEGAVDVPGAVVDVVQVQRDPLAHRFTRGRR